MRRWFALMVMGTSWGCAAGELGVELRDDAAETTPDATPPTEERCATDCKGELLVDDPPSSADPDLCPEGTPTYLERDLAPGVGGSGIEVGDGAPVMQMECGEPVCDGRQVSIERPDGTFQCVEPPPECEEGTYPTWQVPVTEGEVARWGCEPPCELIIHYGGLYGNQTVCAEAPDLECPLAGEVPTWVYETEEWACLPMCDNGLYDQIWLDGAMVCVPC